MKLGKAMSVEHIKRMTLRTVREGNEGQTEFLSFMTALERNDFDENLCKREARHLGQVMTAKVRKEANEAMRDESVTGLAHDEIKRCVNVYAEANALLLFCVLLLCVAVV